MNIKNYLKKLSINFREYRHAPVFTVEQAKKERTYENMQGKHCKTLFLKDRKSRNFYLIVLPEYKSLNIAELEKKLNEKIKFASPENLKQILNLTPGSVSPFGLINDKESKVKIIIDADVWKAEFVNFHPNINTETLEISGEDFHKYINSLKNKIEILDL